MGNYKLTARKLMRDGREVAGRLDYLWKLLTKLKGKSPTTSELIEKHTANSSDDERRSFAEGN